MPHFAVFYFRSEPNPHSEGRISATTIKPQGSVFSSMAYQHKSAVPLRLLCDAHVKSRRCAQIGDLVPPISSGSH